jgi:hypothetical protein
MSSDSRPDRPLRLVASDGHLTEEAATSLSKAHSFADGLPSRYEIARAAITDVLDVPKRGLPSIDQVISRLPPAVEAFMNGRLRQGAGDNDQLLFVPRIAKFGLYDTFKGGLLSRLRAGVGASTPEMPPPGEWTDHFSAKDSRLDTPGHTSKFLTAILLGELACTDRSLAGQQKSQEHDRAVMQEQGLRLELVGIGAWIAAQAGRALAGSYLDRGGEGTATMFPQYGVYGDSFQHYGYSATCAYKNFVLGMSTTGYSADGPVRGMRQMIVLPL